MYNAPSAKERIIARTKNQTRRREDLLQAAQRAIATRGLGALRLRDIAEEAGVTGPAVSYYYPDLDDLLIDVYQRQIQSMIERGPSAIVGLRDPWDQLVAGLYQELPTGPDDIDAIITYLFSGEPRFTRIYSSMSAALHTSQLSFFRSIIDAGIMTDRFTPDLDSNTIARALIALADSYGLQVVLAEGGLDRASAAEECVRVAASLLRVESAVSLSSPAGRGTK